MILMYHHVRTDCNFFYRARWKRSSSEFYVRCRLKMANASKNSIRVIDRFYLDWNREKSETHIFLLQKRYISQSEKGDHLSHYTPSLLIRPLKACYPFIINLNRDKIMRNERAIDIRHRGFELQMLLMK